MIGDPAQASYRSVQFHPVIVCNLKPVMTEVPHVVRGANHMTHSLLLILCSAACRQPLDPEPYPRDTPPASLSIATDSACRVITMTLVGSNNLSVTFPNRATCGSGLVIITAGTPTRSGPGKRNVNLAVRLLNKSAYTIKTPALATLAPSARVVLDPSGQPGSKIIPQNADSLRPGTGEWVWLVGTTGNVPINDSTAAKTISIRLDSPVTTGLVAFTMDAIQVTSMGWTLLTSNRAAIDTTKRVQRPGTNMIMYRTALMLRFKEGVTDQDKQTFFSQNGLTVLGVTPSQLFYVAFSDPGTSIGAYDAIQDSLRAHPAVKLVLEAYHSGGIVPGVASRFPDDKLKRASWLFPSATFDSLWAMRAIRAPLAWGCETGDYGTRASVGLLEWTHDSTHAELSGSRVSSWAPNNSQATGVQVSMLTRDSTLSHSAATGGLLTAAGGNGEGIAGIAWKTNLVFFALRSSERRSILPTHWTLFVHELVARAPRVLSISIEARLDASMTPSRQSEQIEAMKFDWKYILDTLPGLVIVAASGNDGMVMNAAAYNASIGPDLFKAGLYALRTDPLYVAYADRIIIVAGTSPNQGNSLWPNSNVITDATDIAAPAEQVLVMDTTKAGQPVGVRFATGTSLAAPLVAGTAALLLSMDPTLTPSQVKQYLIQGAQVARYDSLNTVPTTPTPVQGSIYQLDAYGALQEMSKSRPNTPVCGYPVTAGGLYVYLQRNGPLALPTDSIRVPGAGNAVGRLSVAQGGRQFSAYTGFDSLAGGSSGVIEFNRLGLRLANQTGYRTRLYLERGTGNIWQPSGPSSTQVTLADGLTGSIGQLTFPDGANASANIYDIDVSPDGRFVSYSAFRTIGSQLFAGVYVKRFSDQGVITVRECAYPCVGGGAGATRWNHRGTRLLLTSWVQNPDSTYTGYYQAFVVDTTLSGGFTGGGSPTPEPDRQVSYGASYTGDDMQVHACELNALGPGAWLVMRPTAALGTVTSSAQSWCLGEDRRIANVVVTGR